MSKVSLSKIFNFKNGKKRNQETGVYKTFGSSGVIGSSKIFNARENTSIIGRVGSYCGTVHFSREKCYVTDNAIIAESKNIDPIYGYYLLKSANLEFYKHGSGQPLINQEILKSITVNLISDKEQKYASQILNTINSKINLNLRKIKILEDIISSLYISWFVEFEPIKSRAQKENKKFPKEINELFPDDLEEINNQQVPVNWRLSKFGNLVKPKRGKVITKSNITPGNVPVVAGGIKPPYYHSKSNVNSPVVTISGSGNAGFVNLYYQNIWASDCSYINIDITDFVYFSYSYLKFNQKKIYHLRHGAVQQHINPRDIMELEMINPPKNLIYEFEKTVAPMHDNISNHLNENNNLSNLKDLILPKLINGELMNLDNKKKIDSLEV